MDASCCSPEEHAERVGAPNASDLLKEIILIERARMQKEEVEKTAFLRALSLKREQEAKARQEQAERLADEQEKAWKEKLRKWHQAELFHKAEVRMLAEAATQKMRGAIVETEGTLNVISKILRDLIRTHHRTHSLQYEILLAFVERRNLRPDAGAARNEFDQELNGLTSNKIWDYFPNEYGILAQALEELEKNLADSKK